MHGDEQGFRVTASVFGRTMLVVAAAVPFWFVTAGAETAWMENLNSDGTGFVLGTVYTWAPLMLLFLAAMLWRFPRARLAAAAGWTLSLLPAAGLIALGWSYELCTNCSTG